jgi:hypothetical protein
VKLKVPPALVISGDKMFPVRTYPSGWVISNIPTRPTGGVVVVSVSCKVGVPVRLNLTENAVFGIVGIGGKILIRLVEYLKKHPMKKPPLGIAGAYQTTKHEMNLSPVVDKGITSWPYLK